jgi:ParB family transcriptional regulator, chromosome partitioning protein
VRKATGVGVAQLIPDDIRGFAGTDALTVNASDTHDGLRREAEDMADSAAWTKMDVARPTQEAGADRAK